MSGEDKAMQPEDVKRLVAERLGAGNAAGVAALTSPRQFLPGHMRYTLSHEGRAGAGTSVIPWRR